MKFSDFIHDGQVRRSGNDKNLAEALIRQAMEDMDFFDGLEVNDKSSRKLVSNYYDFLRSVLEAMTALDGYKVYSHEAFYYYLKEKEEEVISLKFDRFRKLRNRINYYGKNISSTVAKEMIKDIKNTIDSLINKYFLGGVRK